MTGISTSCSYSFLGPQVSLLHLNTGMDTRVLPNPDEFSEALYVLDIAQNDLSGGFRMKNDSELFGLVPELVERLATTVQVTQTAVNRLLPQGPKKNKNAYFLPFSLDYNCNPNMLSKNLHAQGARTFRIHNTGPVGCLPVTLHYHYSPDNLDEQGCVKAQNDAALEFNRQLKDRVLKLRVELPNARITYVDMFAAKYELIGKAKRLGMYQVAFSIFVPILVHLCAINWSLH